MKRREIISPEEEIHQLKQIDYSELYDPNLKVTAYGYVRAFETLLDYSKRRWIWSLVAGVIAGIFIGVAYITAAYCVYSLDNPSLQKLVLGVVFSTIIIPIYFIGGTFLTAYMSLTYPMTKKLMRFQDYVWSVLSVYLGNILGMLIVVVLASIANIYGDEKFASFVFDALGTHKMYGFGEILNQNISQGQSLTQNITGGIVLKSIVFVFGSAVLCNLFVSISPQAFKSTKEQYVGSMIVLFLVIAFFAIPGFQHCVANWFSLWSILFIGAFQNHVVINGVNTTIPGESMAGWFFLINIIPAILGNLAGAFFIGYLLSYFNQPISSLAFKKARLVYLQEEQGRLKKRKDKSRDSQNAL